MRFASSATQTVLVPMADFRRTMQDVVTADVRRDPSAGIGVI